MARDYRKLAVFAQADDLVLQIYSSTKAFPMEERFGLQSQLRRAAVSVSTNIVEGCARPTERDYLHFISIAMASATETRYLIGLSERLGFFQPMASVRIQDGYDKVIRSLQNLSVGVRANRKPVAGSRKPEA